jgi:hypothetical protein
MANALDRRGARRALASLRATAAEPTSLLQLLPVDAVIVAVVGRTPGISCEAVPASIRDGAGMRRHVHPGSHAAESFVSFIPLFDGVLSTLVLSFEELQPVPLVVLHDDASL